MSDIIIMTESGSDISPEIAGELGVFVVPMHVTFGNRTYDDGVVLPEQLIQHYRSAKELPKTSASTPHDFETAFDAARSAHPKAQILYIAYSAVTTCSYQNAMLASRGRPYVIPVDSGHVSAGLGAIVTRAVQLHREHPEYSAEQLKNEVIVLASRARMCFIPDTLEFLYAGGRVSNAAYMGGRLLNIHPCIEVRDGQLVATKKYRGAMKKLVPQLIRDYAQSYRLERSCIWMVYTAGLSSELRALAEKTAVDCGFEELRWSKANGVITSHGGPGAFGIAGFAV